MSGNRKPKIGRDKLMAIAAARETGEHYRDVAKRVGVSPKYVLNVWSGRTRWAETGLPRQREEYMRMRAPRTKRPSSGETLSDEDLGDLYHEAKDPRVRWLALHALQLRGVIRDHLE